MQAIVKESINTMQGPVTATFPQNSHCQPKPGAEATAWSFIKLKAMDGVGKPNLFSM